MTPQSGNNLSHSDAVASELARLTSIAEFRGLEVYRFIGKECPAALSEIGRLREKGFRAIGAGRGVECDLDEHDAGEYAYYQLVAWDPDEKEMVAVYRYQPGSRGYGTDGGEPDTKTGTKADTKAGTKAGKEPIRNLRTAKLFNFSDTFRKQLLPHAIELGRSVVNPSAKRNRFGFFAIWKGLGVLLSIHPETRYFFGTVSLHTHIHPDAAECLIGYLQYHYPPPEPMLSAKEEIAYHADPRKACISIKEETSKLSSKQEGKYEAGVKGIPSAVQPGDPDTPEKRIKHLTILMEHYKETVPIILKSYMGLTNDIWFDGSVIDHGFSDAHIISLIVPIRNIDPEFRKKFMQ